MGNFYATGLGILSQHITMGEPARVIDARIIAIDETHNFNLDDEDEEYIERIVSIYLYDTEDVVHTCEAAGSFTLRHLRDEVRLTEAAHKVLTEDEIHEIYDKYENEHADLFSTVHCFDIFKLEDELRDQHDRFHKEGRIVLPADTNYEEYMEELWEDCRANVRF